MRKTVVKVAMKHAADEQTARNYEAKLRVPGSVQAGEAVRCRGGLTLKIVSRVYDADAERWCMTAETLVVPPVDRNRTDLALKEAGFREIGSREAAGAR